MKRLSAAVLLVAPALVLVTPAPAHAASTCTFSAGVVTADAPDPQADQRVTLSTSGGVISFDGVLCGGATTANTKAITITWDYASTAGAGHAPRLVVDRSGGVFGPGTGTADATGTDRIAITVQSDWAFYQPLEVHGGSGTDAFTATTTGVDLDADGDDDIAYSFQYSSYPVRTWLYGKGGNDTLSSVGIGAEFVPGTGSNTVTGGIAKDTVDFSGNDGTAGVVATLASGSGGGESDTMTGVDNLRGTALGDDLSGGSGVTVLEGNGGADKLTGGPGYTTMSFENAPSGVVVDLQAGTVAGFGAGTTFSAIDRVYGSRFDDELRGTSGADELDGRVGNDVLDGRGGNDYLTNYSESCTLDSSEATSAVQVTLTYNSGDGYTEAETSGGNGDDTVIGCTSVTGSGFDDELFGGATTGTLAGGKGDDRLGVVSGALSPGTLDGGEGRDVLDLANTSGNSVNLAGSSFLGGTAFSLAGIEDVLGSPGNDYVTGLTGAHDLALGAGVDAADFSGISAGVQVTLDDVADDGLGGLSNVHTDVENVVGGSGSDLLYGSGAANALTGGPGDDTLVGRGGDDVLSGQTGNDTLVGATGDDQLFGGDNNDLLQGGDGSDVLHGNNGNDALTGGLGDDDVFGEADSDSLAEPEAGNGSDYLSGGTGTDTVSYAGRAAAVRIALNGRPDDGAAGEYDQLLSDVENAVGGNGSDVLVGSSLANTLRGGPGNDTLDGGLGADTLLGEAGTDTADYRSRATPVVLDLDNVADDGVAGEKDNVRSDVENVFGGNGNDVLTGSSVANSLNGQGGNDTITGGLGADRLDGSTGNDTLWARDGVRDTVIGGTGTDKARVDAGDVRSTVEALF